MDISTALSELLKNSDFKEACKRQAKYRVYSERIRNGTLGDAAAIQLLQRFGYEITVADPTGVAMKEFNS